MHAKQNNKDKHNWNLQGFLSDTLKAVKKTLQTYAYSPSSVTVLKILVNFILNAVMSHRETDKKTPDRNVVNRLTSKSKQTHSNADDDTDNNKQTWYNDS